jgi:hypothetical protein
MQTLARVVDEYVESAVVLQGHLHQPAHLLWVAHVCLDG